jgi:hypothetical protein
MGIKEYKYKGELGFLFTKALAEVYRFFKFYSKNEVTYLEKKFLRLQGYPLDLKNPKASR